MRDLIVIIPVYNAENNISQVVSELLLSVPWVHYVVVDDGSSDRTLKICKEKGYHIISHSNNYGIETALETGYKFALQHGYEKVIRFDGSGFYSAKDIPIFVEVFNEQTDIIIGSRFSEEKQMKISDKIHSNIIYTENNKKILDLNSGFSGVSARIAREIISSHNKTLTTSFISKQIKEGYNVKEVLVSYSQNHKNKYFKKNNLFTAFSHLLAHKLLRKRGK